MSEKILVINECGEEREFFNEILSAEGFDIQYTLPSDDVEVIILKDEFGAIFSVN